MPWPVRPLQGRCTGRAHRPSLSGARGVPPFKYRKSPGHGESLSRGVERNGPRQAVGPPQTVRMKKRAVSSWKDPAAPGPSRVVTPRRRTTRSTADVVAKRGLLRAPTS